MVSGRGQVRASGATQADEIVKAEVEAAFTDPAASEDQPGEERTIKFRTPGFSRMRTEWRGDDLTIVRSVQAVVEDRLIHAFGDAYALMNDVFDVVRTPALDDRGEVRKDRHGFVIWQRLPTGSFEEDWTRLSHKAREDYLFIITTHLFDWEQRGVKLWTEAMLAKAQYEERFSIAYDEPMTGTIEDRTARGKKDAAEERYFAILVAALSRGADGIVRTMALLGQRLKDSMTA